MNLVNKMFVTNRLVKALALGAVLSSASLAINAQTINLSYNGAPDTEKNAVHLFASNLQKLVAEKTGGDL
jgi:TRAP-type C4-dicarboxylate transport system substrate-binding protein